MDKALTFVKKNWHYAVIYILLVFIGYQCTRTPEKVDPVIIKEEKAIALNQAVIDGFIAKEKELIQKGKEDSTKAAMREIAQDREIKALRKKAHILKVEVQPALDTMPDVAALVSMYEEVIEVQAVNIDSIKISKFKMKHNFELRLDLKDKELKVAGELTQHFRETAEHYRKLNRKLRRQNTWLKVGIAAVIVLAIAK